MQRRNYETKLAIRSTKVAHVLWVDELKKLIARRLSFAALPLSAEIDGIRDRR
jgi:hypothetical protein